MPGLGVMVFTRPFFMVMGGYVRSEVQNQGVMSEVRSRIRRLCQKQGPDLGWGGGGGGGGGGVCQK